MRAPAEPEHGAAHAEARTEQVVGGLLRAGVLVAAAVAILGAAAYLARYGSVPVDYRVFRGAPAELRSVPGVVRRALALDSRGIVQLGLLLLIATPVARVVLTLAVFAKQRDRQYVVITGIVLAVLLYGLLVGRA